MERVCRIVREQWVYMSLYTVFIVHAYQTSQYVVSRAASGAALSEVVADGKINVQSACAVNTRFFSRDKALLFVTSLEV
jgi:hypothetical protein